MGSLSPLSLKCSPFSHFTKETQTSHQYLLILYLKNLLEFWTKENFKYLSSGWENMSSNNWKTSPFARQVVFDSLFSIWGLNYIISRQIIKISCWWFLKMNILQITWKKNVTVVCLFFNSDPVYSFKKISQYLNK